MSSIRRRLTVGLLAGLIAILAAGGSVFYFSVRSILHSEFDAALRMRAQALAGLVKWDGGSVEFEFADEHMPSFDRKDGSEFFQIWLGPAATDNESIERSGSLGSADLPARAGSMDSPEFWDITLPNRRAGRAVGVRFMPERESADLESPMYAKHKYADVTLVVAKDRTELNAALRTIGLTLAGTGAAVVVFTILIVGLAVRLGLRPLDDLGARVSAINAQSLSQRFPVESLPAEIQPVCVRLNGLLARLEESFQRERRFGANIAHELRTPIAELRAMAEVALKYPEPGQAARAFQDALDIAVQMEQRVTALLLLIRGQSGTMTVRRETVRPAELIEEIWRTLKPDAEAKRLAVSMEWSPVNVIETDPDLFRTLARNLLANAVEHSPEGGRVAIQVSPDGDGCQLRVENTCEPLSRDDLPRIFEPFWRKDSARSNAAHSGLGLTLAADCAGLLSMQIVPELLPGPALRMTLIRRVREPAART